MIIDHCSLIIDHSKNAIRCATHHAASAPAMNPSTAPNGPNSLLPTAPAMVPTMKLTSALSSLIRLPPQHGQQDLSQDAQDHHRHERAEIDRAERRHDSTNRLDDPIGEDVRGPHPARVAEHAEPGSDHAD